MQGARNDSDRLKQIRLFCTTLHYLKGNKTNYGFLSDRTKDNPSLSTYKQPKVILVGSVRPGKRVEPRVHFFLTTQ